MKKRLLQGLFLVFLLSPISAFAAPQIVTQDGISYCYDNGVKLKGFQVIDGDTYFFGRTDDNPMRTGTIQIDGYTYHFNEDGKMHKGLYTENNKTYYFDQNGRRVGGFQKVGSDTYFFGRLDDHPMRTGTIQIDGYTYHFNKDGKMHKGWYEENNNKYYYQEDGKRATKIIEIDGLKYYFNESGNNEMRTGEIKVDNKYYLFQEDGPMFTGIYTKNGKEYYYDETTGERRTGIVKINDKYYFYNKNGIKEYGFQKYNNQTYFFGRLDDHPMRTGFLYIDGYYYYFKDTGEMVTGFYQTPDGIKRFFGRLNGQMRTGWVNIDGNMYYFDLETGEMATGAKTIEEVNYIFNENGKLKDGFVTDTAGNIRYYFPDGSYANDWVTIAGVKYFFNSLGVMVAKNAKKVIDVSYHNKNIDWHTVSTLGGVDAAMIRVAYRGYGTGALVNDTLYESNISGATSQGLPVGVYVYSQAITTAEAIEEADRAINIVNNLGGKGKVTLPIVIDTEYTDAWENGQRAGRADYLSVKQRTDIVLAFIERVKQAGYEPMIYASKNFFINNLDMSRLGNYKLWVAQYNHYCTYTGNGEKLMWQYSSTETIPGISTYVDVSVMF